MNNAVKRLRSVILLMMVMVLAVSMSVPAFAADTGTKASNLVFIDSGEFISGDKVFTWTVEEDTDYGLQDEEVPEYFYILTINGSGDMPDIKKGEAQPWDIYSDSIHRVVIGERITSVGKYAFSGIVYLDEIDISKDVETVKAHAFHTKELGSTEISFSSKIRTIGTWAFATCIPWNDKLVIPDGVKTLGAKAFYYTDVSTLVLPKSLRTVGKYLVKNWNSLYTVKFKGTKKQLANIYVNKTGNYGLLCDEVKCSNGYAYFRNNIQSAKITFGKKSYVYNGKKQTPKVIVKNSKGTILKKGRDYTVKYYGKRVKYGKYKVKITALKSGKYMGGSRTKYFKIIPKAPKITDVGHINGGYPYLEWWVADHKKLYSVEVQWSTSSTFKTKHSTHYYNYIRSICDYTGMKRGKTYYFRVRAVAEWEGEPIYSKWTKTVKIKFNR